MFRYFQNNDCAQSYSVEADFNYSLSTKTGTLNAYTVNKDAASTNTITLEQLKNASFHDKNYQELIYQIKEGFPKTRLNVSPVLRPFWEVRHRLTACNNNISMDDRHVIPTSCNELASLNSKEQLILSLPPE